MNKLVVNSLGLKVMTPSGWQSFAGTSVMGIKPTVIIGFSDDSFVRCSLKHYFFLQDFSIVSADEINIGDTIESENGIVTVTSKIETGQEETTYSLIEVEGGHAYYTNGIASKNCDFVSDDLTLINPLCLARMSYSQPEFYTGTVRWFKMPEANKTYLVGLDPSVGSGGDAAAIQVFELPGMIQVAEWQHNLTVAKGQVRTLLQILHFIDGVLREEPDQIGEPEIFWTVENNTIGEHVLSIIEDTGEERFPGMFVSERKRKGSSRRFRKGLLTTNSSKLAACARFKSLVESDRCILNSRNVIRELKAFVGTDSGIIYKAKPGEHDDLVMAALLCVRMLDTVGHWGGQVEGLREHISDDELFDGEGGGGGDEAMPVVL